MNIKKIDLFLHYITVLYITALYITTLLKLNHLMERIQEETPETMPSGHNSCTLDKCNAIQTSNQQNIDNAPRCMANFCMQCGINMGDDNPRQLCGKTYCVQEDDL